MPPTRDTGIELATCSVREYRSAMGVPVPICEAAEGVIPRERPVPLLYPDTGRHDVMDLATHADLYQRQLARTQTAAALRELQLALVGVRPPRPLVLLCVCSLANPAVMCHRRLFAAWWQARTGAVVPELGATPLALWGDDTGDDPGEHESGEPGQVVALVPDRDFPRASRRD